MSIIHCDKHGVNFDSDFVEECFKCENEMTEDEALEKESDREIDQMKDAEEKNLERLSDNFGNGAYY